MNFKKLISMVVIFSFLSLVSLSAYPLHAQTTAQEQQQSSVAKDQEKPGAIESHGSSSSHASKSSILPIVLIVVGVAAVALIVFLVILKSYNIVGSWDFTLNWSGQSTTNIPGLTFAGTTSSGNITYQGYQLGTYTVSGSNVTLIFGSGSSIATYIGTFSNSTTMSGTMSNPSSEHGTWTATKASSTASIHAPLTNALSILLNSKSEK